MAIPFDYDDARLWVQTRIGKASEPHWFVLDSGAAAYGMDEGVATRDGFHPVNAGKWGGAGASESAVGTIDGVELHVGNMTLHPKRAAALPLEALLADTSGRHVGGIIGAPLFAQNVVELDFEQHVACLHDPASYRYSGNGVQVPVTLTDGLPLASGALTLPDGRVLIMRMLLDLGAKSTLLIAEPFIDKNGLRTSFPTTQVSRLGAGLGGPTRYAFTRTARIALDGFGLDNAVVGLSVDGTLRAKWYDGLLGADFLSRFRVIFDLPNRKVIFIARTAVTDAVEFDMSGLFLRATGSELHRFVIDEVRPDSPASRAGLRIGDEFVSVDSHVPASLGELRNVLKSGDGRRIKIEYRRDNTVDFATLALKRLQ